MIKSDKLKGLLLEKRVNYKKASNVIGVSITSFSKKMNDQSKFTVDEATKLSNFLDLTPGERIDIFLN